MDPTLKDLTAIDDMEDILQYKYLMLLHSTIQHVQKYSEFFFKMI